MARSSILRIIGWLIAAALMALFGYFLIIELPSLYLSPDEVDPTELGARGEYLGYAIGVPVAIGGALAAVLIALSTDQVARHQMMLAASDYRDKKIDTIRDRVRSFATELQNVRRVGERLMRRIGTHYETATSTTELMDLATADDAVAEDHKALMEALDGLSRAILALAADDVVHAAVEEQRQGTENRIREAVKQFWGETDAILLRRDILDIRDQIYLLIADNDVEDSIAAIMLMPPGYHSLDFLGAFIRVVDREGAPAKRLLRDQALRPGDELMNYGLALLAYLYQLLPSDQMISDTVGQLYGIGSVGRRTSNNFKAREVFFSRTTLEVVNEALDGKRLFLQVTSEDIVGGDAITFTAPGDRRARRPRSVSTGLRGRMRRLS